MKRLLPPLLLGFGIALALIIGKRMSTDAMAVMVGVAVGVAASVPTSLLLVALLRKERQSWRSEQQATPHYPAVQPPSIIVVDPSKYALPSQPATPTPLPLPEPMQDGGLHRLRVIGAEEEWPAAEWTR